MSDLSITVSVLNLASDVFKAIGGDISHFTDELKTKGGELGSSLEKMFTSPLEGGQDLVKLLGGELTGVLGGLGSAGAVAAAGIGGIAAAAGAVGATVFALADHASEAGEQVLAFSQRTGIAIENVGALEFATKAAGGTLGDLTGILKKVEMNSTAEGGQKFAAALKDIGINADAFKHMDSEQQVLALAKGFQDGAKSGNTMADAVAIMGKAGAEHIPLLMKLTGDLVDKGKVLGVQWSEENVKASETFRTSLNTIETVFESIGTRIGSKLLPAVSSLVEEFANSPMFISAVTTGVNLLSEGLGYAVEIVGKLTEWTIDLMAPFVAWQTFLSTLLFDAIGAVTGKIGEFIGWFTHFSVVGDAVSFLGSMFTELKTIAIDVFDKVLGYLVSIPVLGPKIKDAMEAATGAFNATAHAADIVGKATDTVAGSLLKQASASDKAKEATDKNNKAHGDGIEAATKHEKAIQGLVDKLTGENKSLQQTKDAIDRVIKSGNDDIDVKTRVIGEIEKLIKSHQTLTTAQQVFWDANAQLGKDMQKSIEETRKLHDQYAIDVAKDNEGILASALLTNKKWFDDEVDKVAKMTLTDKQRAAELDALRAAKGQKDKDALDAETQREADFKATSDALWSTHYQFLATKAGDDKTAKITAIDDWLLAEVTKLDKDKNVTWLEYYNRLGALLQTAEDNKTKVRDEADKKEQLGRDNNLLAWDAYYIDVAKAHKEKTVDLEVKQVQDMLQKNLDDLDTKAPDYAAKFAKYREDANQEIDKIRTHHAEELMAPLISQTTATIDTIIGDVTTGGWKKLGADLLHLWEDWAIKFAEQFVAKAVASWLTGLATMKAASAATSLMPSLGGGVGAGVSAGVSAGAGAGAAGAGAAGAGASGAGAAAAGGSSGWGAALATNPIGIYVGATYALDWLMGDPGNGPKEDPYTQAADQATADSLLAQYGADSPIYNAWVEQHPGAFKSGGVVPSRFAASGMYVDRGPDVPASDTQLIWATPGEGIVTTLGMSRLGMSGLDQLNRGQMPNDDTAAEVRALRRSIEKMAKRDIVNHIDVSMDGKVFDSRIQRVTQEGLASGRMRVPKRNIVRRPS
jgi:hypothetical protein